MEKSILRDYLEKIRLLETDIYTMSETIRALEQSKKAKPNYLPPSEPCSRIPEKKEKPSTATTIAGTLALGAFGTLPALPFLAYRIYKGAKIAHDNNAAKIECQRINDEAQADYQVRLAMYDKEHALEIQKTNLFNDNLDTQISILAKNMAASETALKQLYDLNIIYYKYRSIIPITMFCEYMDSGLRTELHGPNGMYDLYERQLVGQQIVGELTCVNKTLNRISFQLSSISAQLSGIERNQVMLYEEVARGNAIASEIKRGTEVLLNNCEKHLSAIQASSEMAAFNSEAAARRTDAIARIAEYEFASKHSLTFSSKSS